MGSEWPLVRLGDVVDLTTGFPFASQQYTDDPAAPRLLRGDNVGQGALRWDGAKRWPAPAAEGLDAYWLREGDVILAMDRPWIEAGLKYAYVRQSDLPALLVQRVARLRGSDRLDTGYLRYVIAGRGFTDYVTGIQTGTAVPHISGGQIQGYRFPLPPLAEQRRIAGILGALDDKIELNRRMSQTLESMARALFKSWFIDFDPVRTKAEGSDDLDSTFPSTREDSALGAIPAGWRADTLASFADVNPESWSSVTRPRSIEYVDLTNTKAGRIESTATYASSDAPSRAQRVLRPGDTIFGTVRPGNRSYALVAKQGLTGSTGFAVLRPKKVDYRSFVYLRSTSVDAIDELARLADGAAYPAIAPDRVAATPCIRPPELLLRSFECAAGPWLDRLAGMDREAAALRTLRDELLPRLLVGSKTN